MIMAAATPIDRSRAVPPGECVRAMPRCKTCDLGSWAAIASAEGSGGVGVKRSNYSSR